MPVDKPLERPFKALALAASLEIFDSTEESPQTADHLMAEYTILRMAKEYYQLSKEERLTILEEFSTQITRLEDFVRDSKMELEILRSNTIDSD